MGCSRAPVDVQCVEAYGRALWISFGWLAERWHVNIAFVCEMQTEDYSGYPLPAHAHSIDWQ
jgi:hypothetical protein